MRILAKTAVLGALGALAMTTAGAAVAQQPRTQPPQRQQPSMMNHGDMTGRMMMNDPQMRRQMSEMMTSCTNMMKQMSSMMGGQRK